MAPPPAPWPRLRESWWVIGLAGAAVVLFALGLVAEVRCGLGRCSGRRAERLLSLDALGGLPRLYTTGLFAAATALGWVARVRTTGRVRLWWTAVAGIGAIFAVTKLVGAHSTAKNGSVMVTLLVGVVLTALALAALTATGRRWGVASARPVVLALGVYAAAALGLDAVTSLVVSLLDGIGPLTRAAAAFVEEFGEALSALFVLVTLRWKLPTAGSPEGVLPLATQRPPG